MPFTKVKVVTTPKAPFGRRSCPFEKGNLSVPKTVAFESDLCECISYRSFERFYPLKTSISPKSTFRWNGWVH